MDLEKNGIEDVRSLKGFSIISEDGNLINVLSSGELIVKPLQAFENRPELAYPLEMGGDTENTTYSKKIISSSKNGYIDLNISGGYIGGITGG